MQFAGLPVQVEALLEPASHRCELAWLDDALSGRPRAVLWHGRQGLVAPLSYRRHARLDAACATFASQGWPVELRRSGGGIVPQGPGILNVSLAQPIDGPPGGLAEHVYAHLCGVLARALATLGIDAQPRPLDGSFCDGRFNLAVGARKIAGTAQYWRRGGGRQAVLAHALLLVDADPAELAGRANAFETALGGEPRYRADTLTSVARECGARGGGDLPLRVRQLLAAELAREPLVAAT
ncbi:MAG TPA: lipoate--protein ligase family protein [Casimicrobiaceae bacterium]